MEFVLLVWLNILLLVGIVQSSGIWNRGCSIACTISRSINLWKKQM